MKLGDTVIEGSIDAGGLPTANNSSITTDFVAWKKLKTKLSEHVNAGQLFSNGVVSTYTLVYTVANAYIGGVLAPNGDIHFVPYSATMGQKISAAGVVSTYTLVYTVASAYYGGVLVPNGDIHFVPLSATMGQKISTLPGKPFEIGLCCSPWFNKF